MKGRTMEFLHGRTDTKALPHLGSSLSPIQDSKINVEVIISGGEVRNFCEINVFFMKLHLCRYGPSSLRSTFGIPLGFHSFALIKFQIY